MFACYGHYCMYSTRSSFVWDQILIWTLASCYEEIRQNWWSKWQFLDLGDLMVGARSVVFTWIGIVPSTPRHFKERRERNTKNTATSTSLSFPESTHLLNFVVLFSVWLRLSILSLSSKSTMSLCSSMNFGYIPDSLYVLEVTCDCACMVGLFWSYWKHSCSYWPC